MTKEQLNAADRYAETKTYDLLLRLNDTPYDGTQFLLTIVETLSSLRYEIGVLRARIHLLEYGDQE